MNSQQLTNILNNIMPFVKPIYEKLREEGLSVEECLEVYLTAVKVCIADEMTK